VIPLRFLRSGRILAERGAGLRFYGRGQSSGRCGLPQVIYRRKGRHWPSLRCSDPYMKSRYDQVEQWFQVLHLYTGIKQHQL